MNDTLFTLLIKLSFYITEVIFGFINHALCYLEIFFCLVKMSADIIVIIYNILFKFIRV